MDPPGGRRRQGRPPKVIGSESPTSPADDDLSTETNSGGVSSECRRSSRKKTIKFDVRDLLNKNRKSHKIQIEARIDSNAPKVGTGPASKEELDSKQKNFIEKSAIFRRYSISENKLPPRPPPPPVALIHQTIQQCVGELEQLPLDSRTIDLASISPLARRISRTQEILTASLMKPKQVSSLIVTKLESAMTTRATPVVKNKVESPKLPEMPKVKPPPKRRGRPPKITESYESTTESSNESFKITAGKRKQVNKPTRCFSPPQASCNPEEEECVSNGREISVSPDSSTKGIDLKEMLDASAVTLPQPTILDDCMLVSNDYLSVAAEEEVFTETLSSDESIGFSQNSPKPKKSKEIPLFTRSNSTETNSSDDSERRRNLKVSVKRISLSSPIKEEVSQDRCSDGKNDAIEIFSSNEDERTKSPLRDINIFPQLLDNKSNKSPRSKSARGTRKKSPTFEGDQSTSGTQSSETDTSCDSATLTGDLSLTKSLRMTRARRAKSCKRYEGDIAKVVATEGQIVDPVEEAKDTKLKQKFEPKQEEAKEKVPATSQEISKTTDESPRSRRGTPQKEDETNTKVSLRSRKDPKKPPDDQSATESISDLSIVQNEQREAFSPTKKREDREVSTIEVITRETKIDVQPRPASEILIVKEPQTQEDPDVTGSQAKAVTQGQSETEAIGADIFPSKKSDSQPKAASPKPTTARSTKSQKQAIESPIQKIPSIETNDSQVSNILSPIPIDLAKESKCQEKHSTSPNDTKAAEADEIQNVNQLSDQNQINNACSSSEQNNQFLLRSQKNVQEVAPSSPSPNLKNEKTTQDPGSSGRRTRTLRKHDKEVNESIELESKSNHTTTKMPYEDKKPDSESLATNHLPIEQNESKSIKLLEITSKSCEDSSLDPSAPNTPTDKNVPKNEKKPLKAAKKIARELFASQASDSTDQNSTDTSNSTNSGRRESLRAALMASLSTAQTAPAKKTTKSMVKSNAGDRGSSSSESSDPQPKIIKSRRQAQAKSKEDASSICSESSSTTSSSSSASTSSSTSSSSSSSSTSSSSSATSTTSTSSTTTSSSTISSSSSEGRATRSRKVKDSSQDESPKDKSLKNLPATPSRRAKSVCNSTKTTPTAQKSDSESSDNSTKQPAPEALRKWASKYDDENNETGSESSETSPSTRRTRSGRSRIRAGVAQKPEECEPQSEPKEMEEKALTDHHVKDKTSPKKLAKLRRQSLDARSSSDTCTPPQTPTRPKDADDKLSTDGETTPSKADRPRSKSRRRARKFVPLKDSSSESNPLSDDDTSSNGTSSPGTRMIRNTRARRKTISSSSELADLFIENLSPPDKPIEYLLCRSRKPVAWFELNEAPRRLSQEESKTATDMTKHVDSKSENVESDRPTVLQQDKEVISIPDKSLIQNATDESKAEYSKNVSSEEIQVLSTESQTIVKEPADETVSSKNMLLLSAKLQTTILKEPTDDSFKPGSSNDLKSSEETDSKSLTATTSDDQPKISEPRRKLKPLRKTRSNLEAEEVIQLQKNAGPETNHNVEKPKRIEKNKVYVSIIETPKGVTPDESIKLSRSRKKCGRPRLLKPTASDIETKTLMPKAVEIVEDKSSPVSTVIVLEKSEEKETTTQVIADKEISKCDASISISASKDEVDNEKPDVEGEMPSQSASDSTTQNQASVETASTPTTALATENDNKVKGPILSKIESISEQNDANTYSSPAPIVDDKTDSTIASNIQKSTPPPKIKPETPPELNSIPALKTESTTKQQTNNQLESSPSLTTKILTSLTESIESKEVAEDSTAPVMENEALLPPRVENICTEKHKKEPSPRKKKKGTQLHPDPPKSIKEQDLKINSSESNHSDDSVKTDAVTKPESKMTPRRQLDSSFIESLEKSLLRPISGKKSSKKKDKEAVSEPTFIGKEESKKLKKLLESHEPLKKLETSSPKSKKKQKEASKADKKLDDETPTKRKGGTKTKSLEAEAPKIISSFPDDSKNKPSAEGPPSEPVMKQLTEATENLSRPLKSKGETKFYPNDQQNQEKLADTIEKPASLPVEKEKSPDLVPDPLKDIEKFIEDGVNLLKRGYKLEDDNDAVLDRNILKSDEMMTPKKCKFDESPDDKKDSPREDDNSNSNSECSTLTTTPTSDIDTPNGIRRSHRIKNNSKSSKCLVGRGLVREKERFSMKDDEKTIYSIDDQKMDLAEVEAKNSKFLKDMEERLSNFRVIRENEYKCERVISKEAKRMLCDCFLTPEEEDRGELGCGEDCLNRLLMIECGSDCTVRDRCTNRRFTKFLYSPCRVFRTEKKGFGIMADIEILPGEFIMEYVGEVINGDEFENRRNAYSQDKNKHYYFMALRSDAVIDATAKGNISRFINHSCDPNAETQKWTVNGELRIGFFSRKNIMPGEEITFDYQYQRYGKEAQKCFCESSNCRGWIGEEPSSEEEELDEDDEEESEGTEEEHDEQQVSLPKVPIALPPPILVDQQLVPVMSEVAPVTDIGKEPIIEPEIVPPVAVPVPIPQVTPVQPHADVKIIKKKKEKKRLHERKEEKIKRREPKQFLEDPDIEDEVRFLEKCGLKNQADTLRLSRLIVRAKLLQTRLKLLLILRKGELPCRRLFLDYHGLRLLHGWMSEVIDTRDTEKGMEIRMVLLSVLECLPISNKTMLTDSKVYQTVRDWSNNKESHSPCDGSPKETITPLTLTSSPSGPDESSSELQKLAAKLVNTWDNLPEVFRIPKRERIEQMKEHEREADRQYKGLGEGDSRAEVNRNRERFMRNTVSKSARFKWSRSDKDKERDRTIERRKYAQNINAGKEGTEHDSHLSKEQRRELFAAKVARDEADKRLAEERREFDIKCRFFGLDPKRIRPENMPFCVNPSTGQWYSTDKKPIATPPSYAHVQVPVKPKSTNPEDYRLPLMDLPPLWKFAISPKGKIYYYHVKIRIPQWEPPIKILPLAGQTNPQVKTSESDSSNAEGVDSSEDDIEAIKGLDPVKLQAYIEKKIEDRRLQRYTRLVEEKSISPRKEEDRIYNQMEVRKYKENKEKIRKRKEEIRRRRDSVVMAASIDLNSTGSLESDENPADAVPIQDYLLSSDEENKIKAECNNSPLIDKIVQGDKIVDELDALQCKRPLKRALPIREKYEHKKRKLEKQIKDSIKSTKRSKEGEVTSSSKYRKIREKFRCEIAGIIVHYLKPYRKDTCSSGRILTDDDFNHLARKLTHFVMVKEMKYCESIGQTLVVTESVKNKSREFIKKYMAKYGGVYVRPKNDPEFKEIPFL